MLTLAVGVTRAQQTQPFRVEEATSAEIHAALKAGRITCRGMVEEYLRRIDAYDKNGPALNAIVVTNSDAQKQADELDRRTAQGSFVGSLRRSAPASSRCFAYEWRSVCGLTRRSTPATVAAQGTASQMRLDVSGLSARPPCSWPGKRYVCDGGPCAGCRCPQPSVGTWQAPDHFVTQALLKCHHRSYLPVTHPTFYVLRLTRLPVGRRVSGFVLVAQC